MRLKNYVDVRQHTTNLSLADARVIMRSLIDVTKYCHEQKIIIRNLTPSNVVLKKSSTVPNPSTKAAGSEASADGTTTPRRNTSLYDVKIADFTEAVTVGSFK